MLCGAIRKDRLGWEQICNSHELSAPIGALLSSRGIVGSPLLGRVGCSHHSRRGIAGVAVKKLLHAETGILSGSVGIGNRVSKSRELPVDFRIRQARTTTGPVALSIVARIRIREATAVRRLILDI